MDEHLIPRLHGFELLMASYAMCHMKLELLLRETGYQAKSNAPRLSVYLTNSLQQAEEETDRLRLVKWFSNESNEASRIKRNSPIMVAIGNPPYSGISSNMGADLIVDIEPYKYVDGVHFGERKHWLHDDYVKFIRLGEHFINKNGEGVMGYITNHSWLDNPTFRGMRWHLLNTFDAIYVLDLHGNTKRKEVCPDGSADKNVFDIQQGVSITLAVKTNKKAPKALAEVYHAEVWGSRAGKYTFLEENTLKSIDWQKLEPQKPFYFMVPKDLTADTEYQKGFAVNDLFPLNGVGIVTARDDFVIDESGQALLSRLTDAASLSEEELRYKYNLRRDVQSWRVKWAQEDLQRTGPSNAFIQELAYRPFDKRFIYYTERSSGILARPNSKIMRHMLAGKNIAMMVCKQQKSSGFTHALSGLLN